MIRLTFAAAIAALVFAALPAAQAAPIAPLPARLRAMRRTGTSLRYGGVAGTGAAGILIVASRCFPALGVVVIAVDNAFGREPCRPRSVRLFRSQRLPASVRADAGAHPIAR